MNEAQNINNAETQRIRNAEIARDPLTASIVKPIIGNILFDYEGLKNFSEIFFAILNNKVLEIEYFSFIQNQKYKYIFHPHYLKEYLHRWYVIGYNENEEKYNWTLGLERIVSIKELPNKIYHPAKENIKDYFYDVIGITKEENKEPQLIQLKVHPDFEKYIVSNPFHPSQKNKKLDENNWRDIELNVIINEELINTLMPYIHFIKIVKPKELLDKITEELLKKETLLAEDIQKLIA